MKPYGERLDKNTVRFERLLPGPIERVWQYLTDGDKRARWLAGGNTDLAIGGVIELKFNNASLSPLPDDPPPPAHADRPQKMNYSGEVTRCDPPRLLVHTWEDDDVTSEVEYTLTEQDDRVLLVITHTRLSEDIVIGVLGGWHVHLDILGDVLEGQTPRPFWRHHTALEAEYESRSESG